jgi:hypothetical protein
VITARRVAVVSMALVGAMMTAEAAAPALIAAQTATSSAKAPVYKPPPRGAPGGRIGGGTRGVGAEVLLSALVPDHVGQTVSEQPTVYWYLTREVSDPVEITLIDQVGTRPLLEHRLAPPVRAGIHGVRLADHGVRLAPGVPYQWSIAVVRDGERRSRDVLSGGFIQRVEPPAALSRQLAAASPTERVAMYAEAGLWYDAISAVSERIEMSPNDVDVRRQRAVLLEQVGLREVAEFDRR